MYADLARKLVENRTLNPKHLVLLYQDSMITPSTATTDYFDQDDKDYDCEDLNCRSALLFCTTAAATV